MVDDSQLFAVQQTLKDELGRAVFHELRHVVASGNKQAARDVASLASRMQLAWQETAAVTKLHGGSCVSTHWIDLLEAKHRRLDELSREIDQVERSFAWSKVLYAREEEHIRDVTMQALDHADKLAPPIGNTPGDATFDDDEYRENVSVMTRIACRLKQEEELVELRQAHVTECKLLRERLQEAQQARIDARSRRRAELTKLIDWLQASGVPISKDDLPLELHGAGIVEDHAAVGNDGMREVKTPRRRHLAPVKATTPRLETARRLRYWDTVELELLQRQEEYFTPVENAQTSIAHAAKMYDALGSSPPSAREKPPAALGLGQPPLSASVHASRLAGHDQVNRNVQANALSPGSRAHMSTLQRGRQPKRPIQHARSGPDAKQWATAEQLLLLESSRRVVSEGARNDALVFWLKPKNGERQNFR
jgi:hypothetical protein